MEDTHDDSRGRTRGPLLAEREYLYVALEADRPLSGGARFALARVDEVVIVRGRERGASREVAHGRERLVVALPGRRLSNVHARLRRRGEVWMLEDAGSTNGTYVNGRRVGSSAVCPSDVLELGRVFLTLNRSAEPADRASCDLDSTALGEQPVAFTTLVPDLAMRANQLERVASSAITVLIHGETGVGKEALASGLHALSKRQGPFVPVNCGALSASLVDAQLFGHVRGSFSGAVSDSSGFVRAAHRGTLLLDEVQELSRSGQAALLRVLQEREVVPVGSAQAVKVDVRFVATAPEPLDAAVRDGSFRADLTSRLRGLTYHIPPLRERRQDMGVLVAALLAKHGVSERDNPTLSLDLASALFQYPFPLNVRELEQVLVRGWALANDGVIAALPEPVQLGAVPGRAPSVRRAVELSPDEQMLRERLIAELEKTSGNVSEASRGLGKAPMQLRRWMKRFAIDPNSFRT
jgi:DNA-binding NtrC family response regulator